VGFASFDVAGLHDKGFIDGNLYRTTGVLMDVLQAMNDPAFWLLLAIWPASAVLHLVLIVFWVKPY
jgi:hypothetical protein